MAPPPPPSHTFLASWSGTRVMSWAQNAMTVGHCAIHLGGWGRYKPPPPKQFHSRVKLQRICILRYLNLGLILPNNTWMVMHFFHVMHCSTKSQENPKGPKFAILKFLIRKKMCMFYSSSWMIFLKFKRQAVQESQISAKIGPPHCNI